MKEGCIKYQPVEILAIIQADYKQQQEIDFVVSKGCTINFTTTILEWRDICDLLETDKIWEYLNCHFTIDIDKQEWIAVLEPEEDKTLRDLCNFISLYAQKEIIKPVKLFGNSCEPAAIFRKLVSNLKSRGADISAIRPSSNLESLFNQFGWVLLQEINLNDPMVLPPVNYQSNLLLKYGWRSIIPSLVIFLYCADKQTNWVFLPLAIILSSCLMIYIGVKLKPKSANFPGLLTLADVIRRMDIHRFNEHSASPSA